MCERRRHALADIPRAKSLTTANNFPTVFCIPMNQNSVSHQRLSDAEYPKNGSARQCVHADMTLDWVGCFRIQFVIVLA